MKRGFTLVELLAVIVILAIILAIAVPGISSIINSSRLNSFSTSSKMLENAAKTYMNANNIPVTDGTTIVILYSDIMNAGYISKIVDPISNNECIYSRVYITNTGGSYTYKGALVCDNYMDIDAYNLVTNGNFSNGLSGWIGYSGVTSVSGNILTHTGDGTSKYCCVIEDINSSNVLNKKIYAMANLRVTNNLASGINIYILGNSGGQIEVSRYLSPVQNTWYRVSGVTMLTSELLGDKLRIKIHHYYSDGTTANGKGMEVDGTRGVYMFDLTSIYGAGNEPTVAQMDKIMSNMGK